jgi:hypothetical protein
VAQRRPLELYVTCRAQHAYPVTALIPSLRTNAWCTRSTLKQSVTDLEPHLFTIHGLLQATFCGEFRVEAAQFNDKKSIIHALAWIRDPDCNVQTALNREVT